MPSEKGPQKREEQLKKLIAEKLGVDYPEIVPEASFIDDLGADSLDLVELIMSMEEEFDIDISDEDAERMVTVKDALDCLSGKSINPLGNRSNSLFSGSSIRRSVERM